MPFEEFIYETRWTPGSGWTSCIQGPALACRSWIPFYANRDELDDCELKENWNSDPAIPLVPGSGNGRPNEQFYRKDEFVQNLHLKEYRAAIGIDQPTLYLDRDRRVVGVAFWRLAAVGYTPCRAGPVVYYSPGKKGVDDGGVDVRSDDATIEWVIKFKLGWLANAYNRWVTKHWAPFVVVRLRYRMTSSGTVTMAVRGSRVPSHSVYVDWGLRGEYRMEKSTMSSFREFITAGDDMDAPTTEVFQTETDRVKYLHA